MSAPQITLPTRTYICGGCDSGKTTEAIRFIDIVLGPTCDRLIPICPTFWSQDPFRALDKYVKSAADAIVKPRKGLFNLLHENIEKIYNSRKSKGKDPPHTIIFIDDLAGTPFVQDRGMGDFSNLIIQSRHLNCSIVAIFQQPKMGSYSLRANANVIISFPSTREADMDWLIEEYKHPSLEKKEFKMIINDAWNGLRTDNKQWGQHFLVILKPKRKVTKYYMDWTFRLNKNLKRKGSELALPNPKRQKKEKKEKRRAETLNNPNQKRQRTK